MGDDMSGPLGLSIGAANLVAARTGGAPVTRSSVLTLFGDRPPEVGMAGENPRLNEPGMLFAGFVERVGDAEPLVAADGTSHPSAAALTAAALDGMARTVGYGTPTAIAVPGHWNERQVAALRAEFRGYPALAPEAPAAFICDGTAALAALYAQPGFPNDGAVVLCDFGASGSSITLTDAAANFRQIAPTLRYTGFSGNQLDQMILRHVASNAGADAAGTAPLAPLARRLEQCRSAKELLSSATVAVIPADLPGIGADVRLARGEFEELIREPLHRLAECVADVLQRNRIPADRLAAIATVGGGACIPLVTNLLSERLQAPVVTTSQPLLSAAIGAAVLAQLRTPAAAPPPGGAVGANAAVGQAPAALTEGVAATEIAPAAWAAGAARSAAGQAAADGDRSATYRALAWSQEASSGAMPIANAGSDYDRDDHGPAEAVVPPSVEPSPAAPEVAPRPRRRWFRRSAALLSAAGAAALVLLVAAGLAVRLGGTGDKPTDNVRNVTPPVESSRLEPAPPAPTSAAPVSPKSELTESPSSPSTTVITTQPPVTTTSPRTTYPVTTTPRSTAPTTTPPTTAYPTATYPTTPYPLAPSPSTPYPVAPYPTVSTGVLPTYPPAPAPAIPR